MGKAEAVRKNQPQAPSPAPQAMAPLAPCGYNPAMDNAELESIAASDPDLRFALWLVRDFESRCKAMERQQAEIIQGLERICAKLQAAPPDELHQAAWRADALAYVCHICGETALTGSGPTKMLWASPNCPGAPNRT